VINKNRFYYRIDNSLIPISSSYYTYTITMVRSFLSILLVASSGGNVLAFSGSRQSISRPTQYSLSLSLNNDDDYSSTNTVQKRRSFLVNFAALPILTTFANNAYARDDGKLVYGGEW